MMFWQAPAVLLTLVAWMTSTPASFVEAAQKESLRRHLAGRSAHALTNQDLSDAPAAVYMPPGQAQAATADPLTPPPPPQPPAAGNGSAAQTPPRDEPWWRDRMAKTRASLERSRVLADALQSQINGLQTDVINRDDPAQRAQLQRQLQRALDEHDRLTQQIARDEQTIKDIQTEARRNGIPPGWIR
jgi:hypothetical protein